MRVSVEVAQTMTSVADTYRRWAAAHRAAIKARQHAWYLKNKARVKENGRRWLAAHVEQSRLIHRAWHEAHPGRKALYARRYRAKVKARKEKA